MEQLISHPINKKSCVYVCVCASTHKKKEEKESIKALTREGKHWIDYAFHTSFS